MKFDVVVGNPPYQSTNKNRSVKLWRRFSEKILGMQPKYIALITPIAIFRDIDSNGKKIRNQIKEMGYSINEVTYHDASVFGVYVETCHWIAAKGNSNVDKFVFSNLSDIEKSIINKVVSFRSLKTRVYNSHVRKEDIKEDGKNLLYRTGDHENYCDLPLEGDGILKLVIPFSSSFKNAFITDKPTGMFNKALIIDSKEEGEFIISYIRSPLIDFVAKRYQKTSGFTPLAQKDKVPDLRGYDLDDIYSIFGLTQEEREFVETNQGKFMDRNIKY